MRIASVFEWKTNAYYRAAVPLEELRRRGADVQFATGEGNDDAHAFHVERLRGADVVHCYRLPDARERDALLRQVRRGAALVWDTDDDLEALPRESPDYRTAGGLNARRIFRETVALARQADVVTTTTEALAERYREHGVDRVEVLDNRLPREAVKTRSRKHDGFVIGWVAGLEHAAELSRVPIVEALRAVGGAHPDVRIASLGVRLDLPADRYEHLERVDWPRLQHHISGWDVGIAPLADIPFNRSRSSVKLKEYASAGLPWLASPVGPYVGLGEAQGGRLVPDDRWGEELERLVRGRFDRMRLRRRARIWAKAESIELHADAWERVFADAIERRRERRAA